MKSVNVFTCACGERFTTKTALQFHRSGACTGMQRIKLLQDVPNHVYIEALDQLRQMRLEHPEYRDDQLLLKLLCTEMTPQFKKAST